MRTQEPGHRARVPRPETPNAGLRPVNRNPGPRNRDPGPGTLDPRLQDPQVQDLESRTPGPIPIT